MPCRVCHQLPDLTRLELNATRRRTLRSHTTCRHQLDPVGAAFDLPIDDRSACVEVRGFATPEVTMASGSRHRLACTEQPWTGGLTASNRIPEVDFGAIATSEVARCRDSAPNHRQRTRTHITAPLVGRDVLLRCHTNMGVYPHMYVGINQSRQRKRIFVDKPGGSVT